MNKQKDNNYYIEKILADLRFIQKHMDGVSIQALEENEILLDSMLFRLIQMQESTKKLTDAYKMAHPEIPWTDISGLRNRIVHDYGNVDLEVVHDTLTGDIPWLIEQFEKD
jgi:uncharacterized protein with HEPN domain